MKVEPHRLLARVAVSSLLLLWGGFRAYSQTQSTPEIPANFTLDMETAAHLRLELLAQSIPASGRYAVGRLVFERLIAQVPNSTSPKFLWQLRIVEDGELNAYASPDGTVFVQSGLAQLAGPSTGLWAAILSHEIAHVLRRDWARRYLYQKSLESGAATIVLGDPGFPAASWADSQKLSADMGAFCRQLELEADRGGLMLMAHAGYHPDFVPALHHLLHAQSSGAQSDSLYAMHPGWEERDRELSRAYLEASIEFEHLWPEWYASPGGNPPVVVFTEAPTIRKTQTHEWELQIPLRCQNLAGAVEVVVRAGSLPGRILRLDPSDDSESQGAEAGTVESRSELRQLTGCTSPRTTVTFTLETGSGSKPRIEWTDVYVLDAWGAVLARADVPRRPR